MSKSNDYTTSNILDLAYFNENYRLNAIDLSKQKKLLFNFYKILSISYKNGNSKNCKFVKEF